MQKMLFVIYLPHFKDEMTDAEQIPKNSQKCVETQK